MPKLLINNVSFFTQLFLQTHYGRFWENLSQNSRGGFFTLISYLCIPLTLFSIKNLIKTKKANKSCKGQFKGQRIKKWKNIDFIAFLCSFGVKNVEDSVF